MDNFKTRINILSDIVQEKNEMLQTVLNITHNQKILLESDDETGQSLQIFSAMSIEKQKNIDKIQDNDQLFNNIFESLTAFEEEAQNYKTEIRKLQDQVKIATDLDMKIRLAEEENKSFHKKNIIKTPTDLTKKNVLNKYKNNSNFKN